MKMESVSHSDERSLLDPPKAADYVNFPSHSLLGHNMFYLLHLCDTFTLGNESRSVQIYTKSCNAHK